VAKAGVRISQCMIVKNEEANIERALTWGKGIVSEQIVVDTGSTDRTMEIARQMGAIVYEFPWMDDFSAAKNFAISKARYEWVAFLDADEYLAPGDGGKVRDYIETLQNTEAESLLTSCVNLDNEGNVMNVGSQSRIFKRHLRYEGRVHEHLTSTRNRLLQIADVTEDVTIYHTGYGAREESGKSGRNLRLILLELEERPDSYEMWGYLGQEHMAAADWEQAESALKKAASLIPEEGKGVYDITLSLTYLRLLEVLIHRKTPEADLMRVYGQAIEWWPEEADYDYLLSRYFSAQGKWEQGERHLRRGLELLETYGTVCKSMLLAGEIRQAYELLAVCCHNRGNLRDAVRYSALLLREDSYLMSTLTLMLRTFSKDEEVMSKGIEGARQVVCLLEDFYDLTSLKDRLFVLRAAMETGCQELIGAVRERFGSEELEVVEQALNR
jgi:glycosyltransferase involved in cell wall biosynthesis